MIKVKGQAGPLLMDSFCQGELGCEGNQPQRRERARERRGEPQHGRAAHTQRAALCKLRKQQARL